MQGLVDNKKEYTKYIQESLTISIAEKIKNYFDISNDNKTGLKGFQNELNKIKDWNNNYIENEYNEIVKKSKYKNIDKLYKFVIITSIRIKIYEYKDSIDNVNIKYPSIEDYIHKCFINVAAWAWKNPFLFFKNNLREIEIQNNYNIIEKKIKKIIKNTLIECIPIDSIIQQIEEIISNNSVNQYVELNTDKNNDIKSPELNENYINNNKIKNDETFTSSLFSAITRNTNKLNRFLTKSDVKTDNVDIDVKTQNDDIESDNIIVKTDSNYDENDIILSDQDNDINKNDSFTESQEESDVIYDKIYIDDNSDNELNNENDNNIEENNNREKSTDDLNNSNSGSGSDSDSNCDLELKQKNNFLSDNSYDSSSSSNSYNDDYLKKKNNKKIY